MKSRPISHRALSRILAATLMCLASVATIAAASGPASAKPAQACFQVNNPKWDTMRTMADQFVKDGTLTRQKADAYKCDPRIAIRDSVASVQATMTASDVMPNLNECGDTANIIYNAPNIGPIAIVARQNLAWCWDGWTVSNWGGACDGWATGWGSAIGWSFDGCVSNDFIQYWLNGSFPGGVHHYTKMKFSNITPWTPNQYLAMSTWGHFDGTWDYAYH